jgi:adenosylmethionine-8-amino-7-oxononanoate aminotransferase
MIFYSPEYLKLAKDCCDRYNVLMIFDEVATGFGRTGKLFAAEHADVSPDIMVLGKGLTAGFTGHAATLANDRVFEAFWSDDAEKCFMHGPTFMGNPLACTAALKSLELFKYNHIMEKIAMIESILNKHLLPYSSPKIKETRVLGAIGVMEVHDRTHLKGMTQFAADRGVWLRPFENVAYTMPPYIIQENELMRIINVMKEWFQ